MIVNKIDKINTISGPLKTENAAGWVKFDGQHVAFILYSGSGVKQTKAFH